jgi:hypothetical protein
LNGLSNRTDIGTNVSIRLHGHHIIIVTVSLQILYTATDWIDQTLTNPFS